MAEAYLDTVKDGLIHFTDGSTLAIPEGVTAEWEMDPWYAGWVFRTPAGRDGTGLPTIITLSGPGLPPPPISRSLAERVMQWLREQPSMKREDR